MHQPSASEWDNGEEMKRNSNRAAWGLVAILAAAGLPGMAAVGVWLRPYLVAKYRGQDANLHGAWLPNAPLHGADLSGADLQDANLHGADLTHAHLTEVRGRGADLIGAALANSDLSYADLRGA